VSVGGVRRGEAQPLGGVDGVCARVDAELAHEVLDVSAHRFGGEHGRVGDAIGRVAGREEIDDPALAAGQWALHGSEARVTERRRHPQRKRDGSIGARPDGPWTDHRGRARRDRRHDPAATSEITAAGLVVGAISTTINREDINRVVSLMGVAVGAALERRE
jgi:hypothetical protein